MNFVDENLANQQQQTREGVYASTSSSVSSSHKESYQLLRAAFREYSLSDAEDSLVGSLSPPLIAFCERVLQDRDHWRRQFQGLSQDAGDYQRRNEQLARDLQLQATAAQALARDVQAANGRLSSAGAELRDLRQRMAAERADFTARLQQIQGVRTVLEGSLKKKEKEFLCLQTQLAKIVSKDSVKSAKVSVVISGPPPASSLRATAATAPSLRDAETAALRNSLAVFKTENSSLRDSLRELQLSFDEALRVVHEKHLVQIDALQQQQQQRLPNLVDNPRNNSGNNNLQSQPVPQPPFLPFSPSTASSSSSSSSSSVSTQSVLQSPAGSLARKYLEGTPDARPIRWLVEQANTDIKNIRTRADLVASNAPPQPNSSSMPLVSTEAMQKIVLLRSRLSEALLIIQEQDRLIHNGEPLLSYSFINSLTHCHSLPFGVRQH
jgi:hypothetical protein